MADYTKNKRAYFDYEILQKYEAGIELHGYEVKSIKSGRASLRGAFVIIRAEETYLTNANITPYQAANMPKDYDPGRTRKLLLHKKEIKELIGKSAIKGLTLAPLRLYNKKGKIKLEFALVRGKKKYDKRESIKKRDTEREMGRKM